MANQYTYNPPFSEDELNDAYTNKGMSQAEIAEAFGTTQKVVWLAMKKMGIPARVARKRNQLGENNTAWKGGRVLVGTKTYDGHRFFSSRNPSKAYYMVKRRGHPNANKQGYVFEHVEIALNAAGRKKLDSPKECVHHINFIRTDNRPGNLVICTQDKHREYHGKLGNLVGELLDRGIVGFDKETGYYLRG